MQLTKGTKLAVKLAFKGASNQFEIGEPFTVANDNHAVSAGIVHVRPDNKPRLVIEIPVGMCHRVFEVRP